MTAGSVDIAFRPLQPPVQDSRLATRPLWREAVVAVMRDDDSLVAHERIAFADLEERALIGNPSGSRDEGGGFRFCRIAWSFKDRSDAFGSREGVRCG